MYTFALTSRRLSHGVAALTVAAFGIGGLAPAIAAAGGIDITVPVNTLASSTITPNPAATVVASCVVPGPATSTVWFGYTNNSAERVNALVGSNSNTVTLTVPSLVLNRGQVEQLQPGSVARAFAVSVPAGDAATWTVTVPDLANPGLTTTVSATSGPSTVACPTGTSKRSATIQATPGQIPSVVFTVGNQVRNTSGLLTKATVGFAVAGLTTTCSEGGVPLAPRVLWGYGGPTIAINGAQVAAAGDALVPLPARAIVRTDSDVAYSFVRSYRSARAIANPQSGWGFGATPAQQVQGTVPFARGLSSETVIADVVARCQFGTRIVAGPTTYWIDANGRPIAFQMVTDIATQTTRSALGCLLTGSPVVNCDVPIIGVGPGGPRYR